MKKRTKIFIILSCFLSSALFVLGLAKVSSDDTAIPLSPVYSVQKDGVTISVDRLVVTEDQFSFVIKASRDDGKSFSAGTLAKKESCTLYGAEEFEPIPHSRMPSSSLEETYEILFEHQAKFEVAEGPAYVVFEIESLGYQDPASAKYIINHRGPWRISIPLEVTHSSLSKPINGEVLIGDTLVEVEGICLNELGLTISMRNVSPGAELNPELLRLATLNYADGTNASLSLLHYSEREIVKNPSREVFKLEYIPSDRALAHKMREILRQDGLPLINVDGIESILINSTEIHF